MNARLRKMMTHPLVQLSSDYRSVAHRNFVIELPVSSLFDRSRHQGVKSNKGFGFLALTFPVLARLESDGFKQMIGKKSRTRLVGNMDGRSDADYNRVFDLFNRIRMPGAFRVPAAIRTA